VGNQVAESRAEAQLGGQPTLLRGLGRMDATLLIVGSIIGSGIFVAPSLMAGYLASPALLIGLWVLGGLLTLAGALAYAELAAALPRAGGAYVYLREAFGPLLGFLYGWTLLFAINTGIVAAVAVAFAKYLGVFLPWVGETRRIGIFGGWGLSSAQAVAIVILGVLTAVNVRGLRTGAVVQNTFTLAKVAALAMLVVFAFASSRGSLANFSAAAGPTLGSKGLELGLFAALAVAMSKALFAYDAWYTVAFVAEEVKDPARNLPRALFSGALTTTLVYTAAVAAYIYLIPVGEMASVGDNRVAAEAARRILGGAGEGFIAAAIMISTFGCANGIILAGARVVFAMARDGLFFRSAAAVHPTFRTPANALVLQGVVACLLALTGTYSDLITMTTFSSLLFSVLTIAGLFVLRRRRPDLPRPYRAFGYPLVPAAYLAVSLFFLVFILVGDPRNAGLGLLLSAAGVPAYLWWRRRATPSA
jgi:APA family basic amino acid/polyamine antiporter